MNTFNFNRFWLTLKTNVVSNQKRYMRIILTVFVALTAAYMLTAIDVIFGNRDLSPQNYELFRGAATIGFTMLVGISPSLIMRNHNRKEQRITLFMLPASRLEKFITQIIICIVVIPVCYIIGAAIADILQWIAFSIINPGHAQLVMSYLFTDWTLTSELPVYEATLITIFIFILILWNMSLYLLGGVFFRRYAWLMTTATLYFIFFIAMIILSKIAFSFSFHYNVVESAIPELYIGIAIFTAFTVLNVWLSYRLYSRLQVINNKWFNI